VGKGTEASEEGRVRQDEALKELDAIEESRGGDPEAEHSECDKLMLQVLRSLGYTLLAERIEKLQEGWWWA